MWGSRGCTTATFQARLGGPSAHRTHKWLLNSPEAGDIRISLSPSITASFIQAYWANACCAQWSKRLTEKKTLSLQGRMYLAVIYSFDQILSSSDGNEI